jgi:hypothetical protein
MHVYRLSLVICVLVIFSLFPLVILLTYICHIWVDFSCSLIRYFPFVLLLTYICNMCGFFLFSLSHMLGLFLSLFVSSVHMYYIMGFIRVIRWTFPKDICFTSLYIAGDVFVNKQKCDRNIFLFYYHLTDDLELDT